jgi:hypothetical protein
VLRNNRFSRFGQFNRFNRFSIHAEPTQPTKPTQLTKPILVFLLLGLAASAYAVDTSILPADRATAWNPGLLSVGGIPQRTTVCRTLSPSGADDTAAIQSAVNACPANQVVQLSAGAFRLTGIIRIGNSITLRGAGPGVTILNKTNGVRGRTTTQVPGTNPPIYTAPDPGSYSYDPAPIIIVGPGRWPGPTNSTSVNLTANGVKGAMSVTVTSAAGFTPGTFVLLDELTGATYKPTPTGFPGGAQVQAGDYVAWNIHSPGSPGDDPDEGKSWFSRYDRATNEVKEVASVSGNTVTFTTPIHITYRTANTAQLTRYVTSQSGESSVHVKNAGVEDLTVKGGAAGNIRFECAAYSWAKNIENTQWLDEGFAINNSFRVEIRDSMGHTGSWPQPGGGGYAISLANASSEILIENNILRDTCKVMVARSCGAGSVVAYNYTDDSWDQYDPSWQEVGINASHMAGPHHVLFEGNFSPNADSDYTHGNAIYMTFFRNQLTGVRKSFSTIEGSQRAAGLAYGSWWDSFIGNVMGRSGQMSGWLYDDPSMTNNTANWRDKVIWKIGYDPIRWSMVPDPKTMSTLLRGGNYDYLTNSTHWENVSEQRLPSSLYLNNKPAFFGSTPWPPIGPDVAGFTSTIPAKACFDQGKMPNCLTTGAVPPPPPPAGSACDINSDSFTNVSDVQLCANQAIGVNVCSAGDINQDNACNVIDVQRVVNAALGGQCVTQ